MLGYILSACLLTLIGLGIWYIISVRKAEMETWNKGKCKCGGDWTLVCEDYCINCYVCHECLETISITTNVDRK